MKQLLSMYTLCVVTIVLTITCLSFSSCESDDCELESNKSLASGLVTRAAESNSIPNFIEVEAGGDTCHIRTGSLEFEVIINWREGCLCMISPDASAECIESASNMDVHVINTTASWVGTSHVECSIYYKITYSNNNYDYFRTMFETPVTLVYKNDKNNKEDDTDKGNNTDSLKNDTINIDSLLCRYK